MFQLGACLCLALPLCGFVSASGAAQNTDIAVIVNPGNRTENVSLMELKKMLAGQKQYWPGNTPVKLVVRSPGSRERRALLRLLGMTEPDYKQYWTRKVFRGESQSEPLTAPSNSVERATVSAFPGAIALTTASDVRPPVRILRIDGHLPGDTDYPKELSEYRMKADFLYRFAQFIEWPAEAFRDATSPVTFCVIGTDPFAGVLDGAIAGKSVRGRPLRTVRPGTNAALRDCQMLFFQDEKHTASLLAEVKSLPIATIGDTDGFLVMGGLIEFAWVGGELGFSVNLDAAGVSRLKISSPLLALAKTITGVAKGN